MPRDLGAPGLGTTAKGRILEQRMILVPLSLRKLQRFEDLWPGTRGRDQTYIIMLQAHIRTHTNAHTPTL